MLTQYSVLSGVHAVAQWANIGHFFVIWKLPFKSQREKTVLFKRGLMAVLGALEFAWVLVDSQDSGNLQGRRYHKIGPFRG